MVYQGTVQNGVVVFPNGVQLPEGVSVDVSIVLPPKAENETRMVDSELDPIFRIGEIAQDAGISDLSVNVDHYLYGHPKVTDAK
jgi:hypothetical protein